jgi:hypothetical protein
LELELESPPQSESHALFRPVALAFSLPEKGRSSAEGSHDLSLPP